MVTLELSNGIAWFWNIPRTFHANQCPSSVHAAETQVNVTSHETSICNSSNSKIIASTNNKKANKTSNSKTKTKKSAKCKGTEWLDRVPTREHLASKKGMQAGFIKTHLNSLSRYEKTLTNELTLPKRLIRKPDSRMLCQMVMFGRSCVAWDSCPSILRIWTGLHRMSLTITLLGCRSLHKTTVRFARELSPTAAPRALLLSPSITTMWFLRYLTFLHKRVVEDGIPQSVIVNAFPVIGSFLVKLYNSSLTNNVFPSLWKRANIISLKKSKAPSSPSEFRPIIPYSAFFRRCSRRLRMHNWRSISRQTLTNRLQRA